MNSMTKIGTFAIMAVVLFACNGKKSFTLTCNIDGTNAKEAYLEINDVIDTVVIEDGVFVFSGAVDEPTMASLMVEGRSTNIMVENADMTFEAAIDRLIEGAITGSESQLVFDEFIKENGKHRTSRDEYVKYCTEFVNAHTDSYFTPYLILNMASMLQLEQVDSMVKSLSSEVKGGKMASDLIEKIEEAKAQNEMAASIKVGGTAPDFTMNDRDGKPVKLSDVYSKQKYLLLDFWASWCAPCCAENPNVVENYKKYHDKGFEVLGVSLDKDKKAWEKAIENQGLIWIHVSDLQGWKNAASQQYGIRSIPANLLLDSDGKIVARDLRGEALGTKLSELLDK